MHQNLTAPFNTPERSTALDALRGLAMLWMTVYHFCFDLNSFGHIQQDFYNDPVWTWQRTCILSLFLFCVGWSQSNVRQFSWKRWLQIAACALLVTAGSYLMYPKSFIYFGVLHGICLMLLLLWIFRPLGQWLYGLAGICLMLFLYPPWTNNAVPWNVLGLISQKPITEDYVPILPWFAVVCVGYAFGQTSIKKGWRFHVHPWLKPLSSLGQYSLLYYMLHQPVLIGLLYLGRLA